MAEKWQRSKTSLTMIERQATCASLAVSGHRNKEPQRGCTAAEKTTKTSQENSASHTCVTELRLNQRLNCITWPRYKHLPAHIYFVMHCGVGSQGMACAVIIGKLQIIEICFFTFPNSLSICVCVAKQIVLKVKTNNCCYFWHRNLTRHH